MRAGRTSADADVSKCWQAARLPKSMFPNVRWAHIWDGLDGTALCSVELAHAVLGGMAFGAGGLLVLRRPH